MTPGTARRVDADVAVVGSGFAGSLAALALCRRGRRVALVERDRHPRFAIGESTTPLTNLLLEELADRFDLPGIRSFAKWGPWQRSHADVAVGIKRGFSFYFHTPHQPFGDDEEHGRQLLVGASPTDEVADTHWYRADFDHALARDAQAAGAIFLDRTRLESVRDVGAGLVLDGTRDGNPIAVTAAFVIDASGPDGFLTTAFGLGRAPLRWLPPTQAIYGHFEDVGLWEEVAPPGGTPPYRPDASAVHHVLPGGWIWVLRFNNGITSAGAALGEPLAASIRASEGGAAWARLLEQLPSLREQFRAARPRLPLLYRRPLARRCRAVAGDKWALLPSAAGFIDPLLSTGFPLTLLGLLRLLEVLDTTRPGTERDGALAAYGRTTQAELDVTEQLVAALYATMADPALFKRLSLLYFAAASYSEAARRLGRPDLAPGFLLHAHPRFGPLLRACAASGATLPTGASRTALLARIDAAIEPFDVAGLGDRTRRDWYPARGSDLIAAAAKLDASTERIRALLVRCGLGDAPV